MSPWAQEKCWAEFGNAARSRKGEIPAPNAPQYSMLETPTGGVLGDTVIELEISLRPAFQSLALEWGRVVRRLRGTASKMHQRNAFSLFLLGALSLSQIGCNRPCSNQPTKPPPQPHSPRLGEPPAKQQEAKDPRTAMLRRKIGRFAIAPLGTKLDALSRRQREVLELLIDASRHIDPVFDRQVWVRNPEFARELAAVDTPWRQTQAEYAAIMRGPWDQQAEHEPFAIDIAKPPGGGLYPDDVTREDVENYLLANPERAESLEHRLTVVTRKPRGWIARPYHRVYNYWLEPCANKLKKAARRTKSAELADYLRGRAQALLSDDYAASELAWTKLRSRVQIVVGPHETYHDQLMGLKATYGALVTVSAPGAAKGLTPFVGKLAQMKANLPVDPQYLTTDPGSSQIAIEIADVVFTAGDARGPLQSIALDLPSDPELRAQQGSKKLLLRNLIDAKFEHITRPIGQAVLAKEQRDALSAEAFLFHVFFYELARGLSPASARVNGETKEVRLALGHTHDVIQEATSNVMATYNLLYMIEQRAFQKRFEREVLLTFFSELFRSARFGVAQPHGRAAALVLNYFFKNGVATWDDESRSYRVRQDALATAVKQLLSELYMIQALGNKQQAQTMLDSLGVLSPGIEKALSRLDAIPVDIRPYYPLAQEDAPPMALGWNEPTRESSR